MASTKRGPVQIDKSKHYPPHLLTVIHATERGTPVGRPPIVWKLITNVPVDSPEDAIEKLHWYALRWRIETFHKILKSGCRTEDAKLRTAERLVNLVAVCRANLWVIERCGTPSVMDLSKEKRR